MGKTVKIIESGSFLHGLLNSDFDNFLLYRYLELEVMFAKIIEENNKSHPETTAQNVEFFINGLQVNIADNNRVLRDLEIHIENENVKKGSVSLSQKKKNNLISLNDKTECFIKYLRELISIKSSKKIIEGNFKPLSIPTKLNLIEIREFWFKLTGTDEKGDPYWESENEIEHFINQNFKGFPGVDKIEVFDPNMSKSELNQVTWTFFDKHGNSKTKGLYVKLLRQNFRKFKDDKDDKTVYGNIKDYGIKHLKMLFK